jgi:hypothetical protein
MSDSGLFWVRFQSRNHFIVFSSKAPHGPFSVLGSFETIKQAKRYCREEEAKELKVAAPPVKKQTPSERAKDIFDQVFGAARKPAAPAAEKAAPKPSKKRAKRKYVKRDQAFWADRHTVTRGKPKAKRRGIRKARKAQDEMFDAMLVGKGAQSKRPSAKEEVPTFELKSVSPFIVSRRVPSKEAS